jgi:TonB family protein
VDRFDQRQAFLVSATLHLIVITILYGQALRGPQSPVLDEAESLAKATRVLLPPPEVLRQLVPAPPRAIPRPAPPPGPAPTPPPAADKGKDRISIGPPSSQRAEGPLVLRREDDLTAVPKGSPDARPTPPPTPPPAATADASNGRGAEERPGAPGPLLDPGLGNRPRGDEGSRGRPGDLAGPSIASSLRSLERRLAESQNWGLSTGTGQQMGPLFFDPEGADFTVWVNHFKNEVYRNWIVPQPAILGFRGHVDLEFTVERDGRLTNLRMLKSSGTPALDRAAQNALLGSRLLPLPADYRPSRVSMQVTFFYNEAPQGS